LHGSPANLTVGTESGNLFRYSVPARASASVSVTGPASDIVTGFARVLPDGDAGGAGSAPTSMLVFSYQREGVTIAASGVVGIDGTAFRMFVDAADDGVQTALAIANRTGSPITVSFELLEMNGSSSGAAAVLTLPGEGQDSAFLFELFPDLPSGFRGSVPISAPDTIAVLGLRTRYNERGDFLISTTEPVSEASPVTGANLIIPHVVDSGGYTTQITITAGEATAHSGVLALFGQSGEALDLGLPAEVSPDPATIQ